MAIVSVLFGCIVLLVLFRVQVVGASMNSTACWLLLALDVRLLQVGGWGPALTPLVPERRRGVQVRTHHLRSDCQSCFKTLSLLNTHCWFYDICCSSQSRSVYLIFHHPSKFFWITSTIIPLSRSISSSSLAEYGYITEYFSSGVIKTILWI